ncbi:MAG: LPS export ABC transporter permease LptF [Gammaproteobacteria bacterium]|nr:MAG: LPS export ABC transporter permease LptF [Gammaproteobacteria bacterium]
MLFQRVDRYLLRECAAAAAAVSAVLLLILFGNALVRVLGEIAKGEYPPEALWPLLLVQGVRQLLAVVPIAVFLGILLGLGRLARDSEMIALQASGVGPARCYRAVGVLAVCAAVFAAWLALDCAPRGAARQAEWQARAGERGPLAGLAPGRFNRLQDGVLYFQRWETAPDGGRRMTGVFLYERREDGGFTVQTARHARAERVGDRLSLVFEDGRRDSGRFGSAEAESFAFARYGVNLPVPAGAPPPPRLRALSGAALRALGSAAAWAEWHWRLAVPLACLVLAAAAVPLSRSAPRQGRYGRLGAALLVYLLYFNLLALGRNLLERGQLDPRWGLWWVHALMLAGIGFALWQGRRWPAPRTAS